MFVHNCLCSRKYSALFVLIVTANIGLPALAQDAIPPSPIQVDVPATSVLVREVSYVSPLATGTPCVAPSSDGTAPTCVEPDSTELYKSFKMNVPANWDVHLDTNSSAIFMEPRDKPQATAENPLVADANISVKVTRNPIPVDQEGLNAFAEEIEAGLNRSEQGVEKTENRIFKVFTKNIIDLPFSPGHKAYLYYVAGKAGEVSTRQAIVVASTQYARFRVQLTDHEVSFDKTLEQYFPVITSLQLSAPPMQRKALISSFLPYIIGICFLFVALLIMRGRLLRRTAKMIQEARAEDGEDVSTASVKGKARSKPRGDSDDDY